MEQLIRLALMVLFIPLWFDGSGKKQIVNKIISEVTNAMKKL